ncbi:MAG: hypothetical protein ABWX89_06175, partial [Paeniglutamicibacter terrestris]
METIAIAGNKLATAGGYDDSLILGERRKAQTKRRITVWALRIGVLAAFIGAWAYATSSGMMDSTLVS